MFINASALLIAALKPFLNPKLRNTILRVKAAAEQVFDEVNRDTLLRSTFVDTAAHGRPGT